MSGGDFAERIDRKINHGRKSVPTHRQDSVRMEMAKIIAIDYNERGQCLVRLQREPPPAGAKGDYLIGNGQWIRLAGSQLQYTMHRPQIGGLVMINFKGNSPASYYAQMIEDGSSPDPMHEAVTEIGMRDILAAGGFSIG